MAGKKAISLAMMKSMGRYKKNPASYRDPSGFIFEQEGICYRQVNKSYAEDYECFMKGGLYDALVKEKKIILHTELAENLTGDENFFCTLRPQQLAFITYPYEWCFSQWKDAALLTLELVQKALQYKMILKDATPFNIQFIKNAPLLIDSLSFERYDEKKPWIAYHQFITCFAAPLLLARYRSADMLKIFQLYPDGMPLALVSKLLPLKSLLNTNVWLHLRLPNMVTSNERREQQSTDSFSLQKMEHLVSNLRSFVRSLSLPPIKTQWNNYYEETVLGKEYVDAKKSIVQSWLQEMPGDTLLDIGTNTGLFAQLAAYAGKNIIAIDADTACIDRLYNECKIKAIKNITPLCGDFVNPTPAIGWANKERPAFMSRIKPDIVMALAVIHHLAVGRDINFDQMADIFSSLALQLIIEFVPLEDSRTQLLLKEKSKSFDWYSEPLFLQSFQEKFMVKKRAAIQDTGRVLFLMERR